MGFKVKLNDINLDRTTFSLKNNKYKNNILNNNQYGDIELVKQKDAKTGANVCLAPVIYAYDGDIKKHYNDADSFDYSIIDEQGFTTQGLTYAEGYAVISAYNHDGNKERLYFYDRETGAYRGYIDLNVTGHAGGVTYDPDNGYLYVTESNNNIAVYDYKELYKNMNGNSSSSYLGTIELVVEDAKPATITYANGTLYASTFVGTGSGVCFAMDTTNMNLNNGVFEITTNRVYRTPRMVQGMTIIEHDGKEYMIFAQSYKHQLDSSYAVYEMRGDSIVFTGFLPNSTNGLEGIALNDNNQISGVYEFSSDTTTLDVDYLFDNLLQALDYELESNRDEYGSSYDDSHKSYHFSAFIKDPTNIKYLENTDIIPDLIDSNNMNA